MRFTQDMWWEIAMRESARRDMIIDILSDWKEDSSTLHARLDEMEATLKEIQEVVSSEPVDTNKLHDIATKYAYRPMLREEFDLIHAAANEIDSFFARLREEQKRDTP